MLRSGDEPGLVQEVWALLTLYQLLRRAMADAIETRPGTNPDRASFTTALEAARDQLTVAAANLPRRPGRSCRGHRPRCPFRPAARPQAPLQRPHRQMLHVPLSRARLQPPPAPTAITAIGITVRTPPLGTGRLAAAGPNTPPRGRRSRRAQASGQPQPQLPLAEVMQPGLGDPVEPQPACGQGRPDGAAIPGSLCSRHTSRGYSTAMVFHSWQIGTGCTPGPNAFSHSAAQPYRPSQRYSLNNRTYRGPSCQEAGLLAAPVVIKTPGATRRLVPSLAAG